MAYYTTQFARLQWENDGMAAVPYSLARALLGTESLTTYDDRAHVVGLVARGCPGPMSPA